MSSISAVNPTTAQPSPSVSSNATSADTAVAGLGLPPVGLAQAASVNTVNAALVSSQWGLDPASVAGVYGGAAQPGSNWFSNVELLPALAHLSRGTAEQSLALFGIATPKPGSGSGSSSSTPANTSASTTTSPQAPIPPSETIGAAIIDPLWGKSA